MIATSIQLALTQIRINALRSGLTVLGIIIGIASVVALVSLGSSVQVEIDQSLSGLGADTLSISPGPGIQAPGEGPPGSALTGSGGTAAPLTDDDLQAVADVPGVDLAVPIVQQGADVTLGSTERASVIATTSDLTEVEGYEFAAGGFFSPFTDEAGLPVAVLGAGLAETLGVDPVAALDQEVIIDSEAFTVIGVLGEVGGASFVAADDAVLVPLDAAREGVVDDDGELSQIRVAAPTTDELIADVEAALRTSRDIDPADDLDVAVTDAGSINDIAGDTTALLTTLVTAIGGISLVVGAIGIANMMLVAVRERTREIGVRRAVGATRRDITTQFLIEAIVLSAVGGIIGVVVGVALNQVVAETLLGVTAIIDTTAVALALGVSVAVGVAAGLGPAISAASVDPTTALRYE